MFMAGCGAAAGEFLGGVASAGIYPDAGGAAVALGVVSASVLGALGVFLVTSFLSVSRAACARRDLAAEPARAFSERTPR